MSWTTFWDHNLDPSRAMQPFTWQHGILIILGILSVVLTMKYGKKIHAMQNEGKLKIGFAIWLLFLEFIYHMHYWTHGMFSVPLHICSFGVMFSITLLLTDNKKVFEILFFLGIFGGLLALFIPNSLGYTYYNMRYYHFILLHMSIAIVPIYYYKAYEYRVTYKSVLKTIAFVFALLPLVMYVNTIKGKNYMFIGEKPEILSSVLPAYPYYIFLFIGIGVVLLNILTYVSNTDVHHWKSVRNTVYTKIKERF